jgi:hypothetical protein
MGKFCNKGLDQHTDNIAFDSARFQASLVCFGVVLVGFATAGAFHIDPAAGGLATFDHGFPLLLVSFL